MAWGQRSWRPTVVQNLKKLEEDIESGALQPASAAPAPERQAPVDNGMLSPSGDSGALYDSRGRLRVPPRPTAVHELLHLDRVVDIYTVECSSPCWRIMRV